MSPPLVDLFHDQDFTKLRLIRPSKFLFLCGGALCKEPNQRPSNLRDYILRYRPAKLSCEVVLAERAADVYRETTYQDLITLEEDIARIAAIVLVIAESAGALAELGAFASSTYIQPVLRIVMQDSYYKQESFVRYGPIQRIRNRRRDNVGVYPWRSRKNGFLVLNSVRTHCQSITSFINQHVKTTASSALYTDTEDASGFYVIYWVIYLGLAMSRASISSYIKLLLPLMSDSEIKNRLYVMKIVGWIDIISYSGGDYYIALFDVDPFDYSFLPGVKDRDSPRRKMEITRALRKSEPVDRFVLQTAAKQRRSGL